MIMNSQINELLDKDNSEIIRDRIAGILKVELLKQKELAESKKDIENKKDFDINVFIENLRPWEISGDETFPFPLVNVCLQETSEEEGKPGATVGKQKFTGTYFLDCYGCGNLQKEENYKPDDSLSAIRAWHTARIVRKILMSGFYVFLGMKGIVTRRRIKKIVTMTPNGLDVSAYTVAVARIIFEVDFYEEAPEGDGVNFEGISFTSNDAGEVNLIGINSDNTIEGKKE